MFCNEEGCDCRRVFLCVVTPAARGPLAIINYGWEDPESYAPWFRHATPEDVAELKGPSLVSLALQSDLAPALLKVAEDVLFRDGAYVERVKRHYRMFRERIDGSQPAARKWPRHRLKRRGARR